MPFVSKAVQEKTMKRVDDVPGFSSEDSFAQMLQRVNESKVNRRESWSERFERESFEDALCCAQESGLVGNADDISREKSGHKPGMFSSGYLLKNSSGDLVCELSQIKIAEWKLRNSEAQKLKHLFQGGAPHEILLAMQESAYLERVTFHGGFYEGQAYWTPWKTLKLALPPFQELGSDQVSAVELINAHQVKSVAAGVAGGLVGGVLLGAIGAVVGSLAAGSEPLVVFKLVTRSGAIAVASASPKTYAEICCLPLSESGRHIADQDAMDSGKSDSAQASSLASLLPSDYFPCLPDGR